MLSSAAVQRTMALASVAKMAAKPSSTPFVASPVAQRPAMARPLAPPAAALPELVAALHPVVAALDIDWSDPDVQIGAAGAFLGVAVGIGAPLFYISRDERDEERLEELRALNRATKAETGDYLSQEEIEAIRPPRWTDRREFVDDD
jgi:hypothetical protein